MTCAIDVDHIYFSYNSFSLEDIKTELHVGEHKALIGLNGSGKTTLFKVILGLLEPSAGDVYVFDRRVTKENLWEIRRDIGFLFQNPDDQLFAPTVWEDIAFGPRNLSLPEPEVDKRVTEALEFVGMTGYEERPVSKMSHGEAKRVALAGILAMQPRILFLDEPFSGLDFPMIENILDIFAQLRREGISVMFTTHNRFFIEYWADSVAVLKDGHLVYDGPTDYALSKHEVISEIGDWDRLRRKMDREKL
jgi:cobalt/nickel transport system ATP-binding protein